MNKGKQWKWSKKVRKEMEKQKTPPLKINVIKAENPEKYIMPVKKISKKEAAQMYPKRREGTLKLDKDNLSKFEKGMLEPTKKQKVHPKRPKRFKGICLNWPEEVKKNEG